ncbi:MULTISPECIES: histidinol-phosphatase HisJ family protein [unclassified Ruminococcus]|uniref:histidinol-phosphatase HisJ family protein n=1 Tax=unclassified Ruminococcus TaxID=2608920 RepID=UPI00210B298A|nr:MULTISPECIES: histidinol-phosphatase HisJ family protein [unclassified Ruminococcus]MCQ4022884.1 histidinol-phosphatase HisJ family protein [Ruminococcus sp. zg-924]MCQ4115300.1 histidinol-phosphatase HisJ family protein [Ruminococcus sp. zg-921]
MKNRIIVDSHTHSNNSFDAENSVSEMLNRANEIGLDYLTITDHFESAFYFEPDDEFGDLRVLLPQSVNDVKNQQKINTGKTELLCGIELGEPLHNIKATDEVLGLTNFDFVLCSTHNLRDMGDFFWLDYKSNEIPSLIKKYFRELCECVQWGGFDSLAHITYPMRYICDRSKIAVNFSDYKNEIDELLSLLAERDKALEFNTCRNCELSLKTIDSCRDIPYLKRYKELCGRYVTLGSDAHKIQDLGKGIDGAIDILCELGYSEITVFKQRKPMLIPIK